MTATFLPIESLRCYDVVAIALLMFAVDAAMHAWRQRGSQLSPQETALLKQYNEQVAIVNRLNSVETFVEQSKAIRKMNTVKKQMQELAVMPFLLDAVERIQKAAPSNLQKRINQMRTPVIMGLLMVLYWNQPLVVLPQGYMIPFERLLSFPGFPFGAISAVGWAGVCRRVGTKVLG